VPTIVAPAVAALISLAPGAERPNVVVFFMDDLGYGDLASYGARDARTPSLDRLAAEGVRLTQCYAAAPVCTPTRAAFMTGRYQHRVGLEDVIAAPRGNQHLGLSPREPTLPRYLKDAGYATALVGKWHLGAGAEFRPTRHGVDEFFGFLGGALDYYSHRGASGEPDLYENDAPVKVDGYLTDLVTARAVSFIERHASGPFFIDVAFNAVHWPFQRPDLPSPPPHPSGQTMDVVRQWAASGTRADYVAMLERADRGIGEILAVVDRLGLRESTLVVFTSDNGGEWLSRMDPLFNRKGTLWEGGLRVPCILRWPARLPAGRVSSQLAITMDLTATILAAASVSPSRDRPLDGIDLVPTLSRRPVERTFFWRSGSGGQEKAVREGRWKLVSQSPLFPGLLFDVAADPAERNDLAAHRPDVLRRLAAKHEEWERAVAPTAPPDGTTPPLPEERSTSHPR